jgi:predicted RNase H-like nuclease (RuvC/YqgF family)
MSEELGLRIENLERSSYIAGDILATNRKDISKMEEELKKIQLSTTKELATLVTTVSNLTTSIRDLVLNGQETQRTVNRFAEEMAKANFVANQSVTMSEKLETDFNSRVRFLEKEFEEVKLSVYELKGGDKAESARREGAESTSAAWRSFALVIIGALLSGIIGTIVYFLTVGHH